MLTIQKERNTIERVTFCPISPFVKLGNRDEQKLCEKFGSWRSQNFFGSLQDAAAKYANIREGAGARERTREGSSLVGNVNEAA